MTLAAEGVSEGYDGASVLSEVTLSVSPGEVVTVVGPSGTGKTTLLRLLGCFRPPGSGTISWEGRDVWSLTDEERLAVRRRLGMVFQEASLFNTSVAANVAHGLTIRRDWPTRIRSALARFAGMADPTEAVYDALEAVDLVETADRNALSLSGGEAQRVAFARALAVNPDVLLLDEPTSNLDPRNTAVLERAIEEARDRGLGVAIATHDMHQARRLSDRVGVLIDGELVEFGPPERIFESPTDERTARFVAGELVYDPGEEVTAP